MKKLLTFSCLLTLAGVTGFGQSIPDPTTWAKWEAPRWRTNIEVGVQVGQVRPDATNYYGGYYPYYPTRPSGNRYSLSIHGFTGYRIKPTIVAGATAGVDWYSQSQFFPVGAAVQGDVLKGRNRRVTPFYNVESGYAFRGINPHGNDLKGGWFWAPGVGIRINTGNHTGFIISTGYKQQRARQESPVDGVYTISQVEYRRYNRVYFRMGFSF